jgi:hypothetical protein
MPRSISQKTALDQRGTSRAFVLFPDVGGFQAPSVVSFRLVAPPQVVSGEPFDLTVIALDAWGHTASTYTGTVHSDPHAALPDDNTFVADDGGQQTFGVRLQTADAQTITAHDVASVLQTGSVTVDVTDDVELWEFSAISWKRPPGVIGAPAKRWAPWGSERGALTPAGTSPPRQARRLAPRVGQEWNDRARTFRVSPLTPSFL